MFIDLSQEFILTNCLLETFDNSKHTEIIRGRMYYQDAVQQVRSRSNHIATLLLAVPFVGLLQHLIPASFHKFLHEVVELI